MTDTTYFFGGEDIDFVLQGTVAVITTSGHYDSNFARCSLQPSIAGNGSVPPTNRMEGTFSASVSSFWFHCEYLNNLSPTVSGANLVTFLSPDGVTRLLVRGTGTAQQIKLSTRNAAGTITDLATATGSLVAGGALGKLDIFINYAVSGEFSVYNNSVQIATFSGDVTTNAATQINQFHLAGTNSTLTVEFSQVLASSGDTRSKRLWLMNTSSAGNADAWTGTLANVNKSAINDTTFISSASNNQIQEYLIATAPTGTFTVDSVGMSARALVGATGPQHFQFVTRLGGADFFSSDRAPIASFGNFGNYIQATNPNTTSAWQLSDLTTAGVNYGVKSTA